MDYALKLLSIHFLFLCESGSSMNSSLHAMFTDSYGYATVYSFLFDSECAEYKYYQYRVAQEEAILAPEAAALPIVHTGLDLLYFFCSNGT